jgi:hypothetical protein
MTGKPDTVEAARSILTDLTDERDRVDNRLAEITTAREQIAHSALTGDAAARERLEALKKEAGELADHCKDVDAAIAHAQRNVATAEAAEHRKEEVAAANRRKVYAERLRTIGREADEGKLGPLAKIPEEAQAAGVEFLTIDRVGPLIMIALYTAWHPLHRYMGMNERRVIAPSERTTFSELLGSWAHHIDLAADQVIAGKTPRKEAA